MTRLTARPSDRSAAVLVVVEAGTAAALAGWAAVWARDALPAYHGVFWSLVAVAVVALVVAGLGLRRRARSAGNAPAIDRRYLTLLAVQLAVFVVAGIAVGLAQSLLVPVVALTGVGLHFFLLTGVFADPRLDQVASALLVVTVASVLLVFVYIPPVFTAGWLGGAVLIVAALVTLARPLPASGAIPPADSGTVGARR